MSTTTSPTEEPEASWSQSTTPVSDDPSIEEILRQVPTHVRGYGVHLPPLQMGASLHISGVPRTLNQYEFAWNRTATTQEWNHTAPTGSSFGFVPGRSNSLHSWSSGSEGYVVVEEMEDVEEEETEPQHAANYDRWSEQSNFSSVLQEDTREVLLAPKVESPEESLQQLSDLHDADQSRSSEKSTATSPPCPVKRGRGRPRKHPLPVEPPTKSPKGRSKTGCMTCRKRKKKCDETKPTCKNCDKNAVVCEGYPERQLWKSGREKAQGVSQSWAAQILATQSKAVHQSPQIRGSLPQMLLQPAIHGIETYEDRIFFKHYFVELSRVLTVEDASKSAFRDLLLPEAIEHIGLMHSILALASSNINFKGSYGRSILRQYPDTNVEKLHHRGDYHKQRALRTMIEDMEDSNKVDYKRKANNLEARYGQMLCLIVQGLSEGKRMGDHRMHLVHYQKLIKESAPANERFLKFTREYFRFHIVADGLVSLPGKDQPLEVTDDHLNLPCEIQPKAAHLLGVHDGMFREISNITNLRDTIRDMKHNMAPLNDPSTLNAFVEIDARIRAWTPSWQADDNRDIAGKLYQCMTMVYLYRTIYPLRRESWVPDPRITSSVNCGLEYLTSFSPTDPHQTVLLTPAFLIGCAAFELVQRDTIRKSISTIHAYTHLNNTKLALDVLEKVWMYMDTKDEMSWDWQLVASEMGINFLAT